MTNTKIQQRTGEGLMTGIDNEITWLEVFSAGPTLDFYMSSTWNEMWRKHYPILVTYMRMHKHAQAQTHTLTPSLLPLFFPYSRTRSLAHSLTHFLAHTARAALSLSPKPRI